MRELGVPEAQAAELAQKILLELDPSRRDLADLTAVILKRLGPDKLGPKDRLVLLLAAALRGREGRLEASAQVLLQTMAKAMSRPDDSLVSAVLEQSLAETLTKLSQDPLLPKGLGARIEKLLAQDAPWRTAEKAPATSAAARAQARAPPGERDAASLSPVREPSLLQTTQEILDRLGLKTPSDKARISKDPHAFNILAGRILAKLPSRPRRFNAYSSVAEVSAQQKAYSRQLLAVALPLMRKKGIERKQVISHGTTLRGLIGMLFSGHIEPTSTTNDGITGISGEAFDVWGSHDIEEATSYAAAKSVRRNLPGVLVLLHNPKNPLIAKLGSIDRRPSVKEDFLAAIITDGERSLLLDKEALQALASSSDLWRRLAVSLLRRGQETEYHIRESFKISLSPDTKDF